MILPFLFIQSLNYDESPAEEFQLIFAVHCVYQKTEQNMADQSNLHE